MVVNSSPIWLGTDYFVQSERHQSHYRRCRTCSFVPAQGRNFFSFVARWGSESELPVLSISWPGLRQTIQLDGHVRLNGSVSDADDEDH
jgi:hypothetical protein